MASRLKITCAALIAFALAGCGQPAQEETPANPPEAASPAPAPPPPPATRAFDAVSNTAEAFTGGLTMKTEISAGDATMTLTADQGQIYQAAFVGAAPATADIGDEAWTAVLPVPDTTNITLYRVAAESIGARTKNGGFCGEERTTILALAEFMNAMNEKEMQIAAFKNAAWPPKDAPLLCGTYTYVMKPPPAVVAEPTSAAP